MSTTALKSLLARKMGPTMVGVTPKPHYSQGWGGQQAASGVQRGNAWTNPGSVWPEVEGASKRIMGKKPAGLADALLSQNSKY